MDKEFKSFYLNTHFLLSSSYSSFCPRSLLSDIILRRFIRPCSTLTQTLNTHTQKVLHLSPSFLLRLMPPLCISLHNGPYLTHTTIRRQRIHLHIKTAHRDTHDHQRVSINVLYTHKHKATSVNGVAAVLQPRLWCALTSWLPFRGIRAAYITQTC